MSLRNKNIDSCACGREKLYTNCCGLIHKNISLAITAEDLMRSRYTAFVKANINYLQKSHHSTTRPTDKEAGQIKTWAESVSWLKLEIVETTNGLLRDTSGTVTFKAYFLENGRMDIIHENSFFEKENGLWMYKNAL